MTYKVNNSKNSTLLMVEPSATVKMDKWCTYIVLMLCIHFQIYYHMVVIFITSIYMVLVMSACGSKRHSLQAVQLSQWFQAAVQIVSNLPAPSNGGPIFIFWACRPCGPAGWLALQLTKAGDVETNPGPTTLNKKVWICDMCHKQIHVRKQISIRCNRIEHWVHLRCAGIRQAQYTDTWTCHLHRESRLTSHTDITPPHRSRPLSKPPTHSPPTPPHPHHRNQNTDTCPTLPLSPEDW